MENINDVLQAVSKLASEYVPGRVTKAQAERRHKMNEPEPEPVENWDKETDWDGKDEIIKRQNSEILFLRDTISKLASQKYE